MLANLCEQVTPRILARVERYWSFESFSSNPDPRLIAGMYGDVVAPSEGGGVPGVASSATSWSWIAGRAATALTGTAYFPDRWKYWLGSGEPAGLRNFVRNLLCGQPRKAPDFLRGLTLLVASGVLRTMSTGPADSVHP